MSRGLKLECDIFGYLSQRKKNNIFYLYFKDNNCTGYKSPLNLFSFNLPNYLFFIKFLLVALAKPCQPLL